MAFRGLVLPIVLAAFMAGCGKTTIALNHTLIPVAPGRKATADCNNADTAVHALLFHKGNFINTHVIALADGSCAVQILIEKVTNDTISLLENVDATSKSFTYYKSETTPVAVNTWIDDAPDTFKGADGKVLDTSPSVADCNSARDALTKAMDGVVFTTAIDQNSSAGIRRCYVDAVCKDDPTFTRMLGWVNPKGHGEPFHYYVTTNGVTKVVYVHLIEPIQN